MMKNNLYIPFVIFIKRNDFNILKINELLIFFHLKNNNKQITVTLNLSFWWSYSFCKNKYCRWARVLKTIFKKVHVLLGQKAALNLWYVDTSQISKKLFPSIWRSVIFCFKIKIKIMFSYIFYAHNSIISFQ